MHVGVMGAGAIGGYLGGRLAAAGAAVTLVGRPDFGVLLAEAEIVRTGAVDALRSVAC